MTRIVNTHYRYKRPPREKAPAPLAVEPVVTIREPKQAAKPAKDDPTPTRIVTARRPGRQFADVPDMTPE